MNLLDLVDAWEESAERREAMIPVYRRENGALAAAYAEGVRDAERGCAKQLREHVKRALSMKATRP
jgi:hypothetical protein